MAANMEMSEWIKFFTAAGIPAGSAAKYSVVFLDNRIQKSMLMDLTKEYLKEMGISIMGDVIATLKYAKTAHIKYENEKPALTALSTNPDAKVEVKRQTTAGNRMLEHYMRKEGLMEGSSSKVTVSPSMAVRLGAVPVGGTKKTCGILGDTAEVTPVKRPRMVKPEEEGKYVISLPKGTTPKTMKILEQKQQQHKGLEEETKSSVFARLGSGNSPTVTQPVQQSKNAETSAAKTPVGSNVFNRLGSQRKRVVSGSQPVEYQGVLKSLTSPSLTPTPAATTVRITKPTPVQVTMGASKLVSATPEASLQKRLGKKVVTPNRVTTSADGAKNVMARLGALPGKPRVVATPPASTKQKVTVTIGGRKKVATKRSALDRLGVQKPEVSTTTHMDAFGVKSKVQDRLGGAEPMTRTLATGTVKLASERPIFQKSMQARLGAPANAAKVSSVRKEPGVKQRVTVTLGGKPTAMQKRLGKAGLGASKVVASPATASTKVLKRLGAPVGSQVPKKKSTMQDRLGLMRAEATSTTPSITVTMGGPGTSKKTAGQVSKQNVFSRLGS
eukprot:XP_003726478.1 PREDICTED: uncharacterized protein C19orf47 homolog isoform X3 [Strongylocentrotus purpuratus]